MGLAFFFEFADINTFAYVAPAILYYNTTDVYRAGGPGWRLFTNAQSIALANLPGEIG